MTNSFICGALFGDEGKGRVVDWLCRQSATRPALVVRFSGGQQAGHHVVAEDFDHVYANFGSGSHLGIPTHIMPTCTIDPIGIVKELQVLQNKGVEPTLLIDGKCPVTTPYEFRYNQTNAQNIVHGTCGCGVGATWRREEMHHSILFEDLFDSHILGIKTALLSEMYNFNFNFSDFNEFILSCGIITSEFSNINLVYGLQNEIHFVYGLPEERPRIYEGSQGLLLDKKHGFFPYVTRSDTDTLNIENPDHIYCVTRAYQTRHGNGPMTNLKLDHRILENPHEQNFDTEFQGEFRRSILDLSLLEYALMKDPVIRNSIEKTLVITCLDLLDGAYQYTYHGELTTCNSEHEFVAEIKKKLNFKNVLLSRSATGDLEEFAG